jgi:hypothetical protein
MSDVWGVETVSKINVVHQGTNKISVANLELSMST